MRTPDAPVRGKLAQVRRATSADADTLVAWHADPDVAKFWDNETFTRDEMLERLARPDVDHVTVDPYRLNERAVRGWEKAGFRRLAKAEPDDEHTQPWFVMAYV